MKVFGRVPIDVDEVHIPCGQVYLIPERCKGCNICVEFCPKEVLQISNQTNTKGYHLPEIAEGMEEVCVHCDFCTVVCPEFAIFTVEVQE
jgi:2-oxoglutarate ferredoxin oxidoreductase subunit delta